MNQQQIKELKGLMHSFRTTQGEEKRFAKTQLLAYLAGVLDSIEDIPNRAVPLKTCCSKCRTPDVNTGGVLCINSLCECHISLSGNTIHRLN